METHCDSIVHVTLVDGFEFVYTLALKHRWGFAREVCGDQHFPSRRLGLLPSSIGHSICYTQHIRHATMIVRNKQARVRAWCKVKQTIQFNPCNTMKRQEYQLEIAVTTPTLLMFQVFKVYSSLVSCIMHCTLNSIHPLTLLPVTLMTCL